MNCSIKYNIPFYHGRKNICYLNPLKDGQRVELAFLEGKKLSSLYHILDMRDRKSVAGFILNPLQEIPWDELVCIMQDALK